jgi:hypothetical protein
MVANDARTSVPTSARWSGPHEGSKKPCAQPGRDIKRDLLVVTELEAFPEQFGRTSSSLPLRQASGWPRAGLV